MIGAIGGGAITALYGPPDGSLFAVYSIGLVVGMALYLLASLLLRGKQTTGTQVLGGDDVRDG